VENQQAITALWSACRRPPRKVTYFEPVQPHLARNTIIESTSGSVAASAVIAVQVGRPD
jgi:hypothetical protein